MLKEYGVCLDIYSKKSLDTNIFFNQFDKDSSVINISISEGKEEELIDVDGVYTLEFSRVFEKETYYSDCGAPTKRINSLYSVLLLKHQKDTNSLVAFLTENELKVHGSIKAILMYQNEDKILTVGSFKFEIKKSIKASSEIIDPSSNIVRQILGEITVLKNKVTVLEENSNSGGIAVEKDPIYLKDKPSLATKTDISRIDARGDFLQSQIDNIGGVIPPNPDGEEIDVIIVAGQSNSVCYTGTNGALFDVVPSPYLYEYKPSVNNIAPFINPVGEAPSNAGASMGYITGGTFFNSMGNEYIKGMNRKLVIIPCGNPGVTSSSYYKDATNFSMLMSKWNSFKTWLATSEFKLGNVNLVWHQGESGTGDANNMKASTKKVFDDISTAIGSNLKVFFCRISQNDACDNATTKAYNKLFLELNEETPYTLISANQIKYYWLNQFADVHHYDQYACNDMGKEIGKNIVMYYALGGVKPEVKPFETDKGGYDFSNFVGVEITNNQLCYFRDSINNNKYWALGSKLYDSWADIKPIVVALDSNDFSLSFDLYRGDKEGTGLSPVFGGNVPIMIDSDSITFGDVALVHNVSPFIVRGGNITKTTKINNYKIVKSGTNISILVNGILKDTKLCPVGLIFDINSIGKHGNAFLEGVVANVQFSLLEIVPPNKEFDYIDNFKGTYVVSSKNTTINGDLEMKNTDTIDNITVLNKILTLRDDEAWRLDCAFTPTSWGVGDMWTILGTAPGDPDVYAVQSGQKRFRIYMNGECYFETENNLTLNQKHTVSLISDGTGDFTVITDGLEKTGFKIPDGHKHLACNCKCVGQSFFNSGNMNHSGLLHYLHINGNV